MKNITLVVVLALISACSSESNTALSEAERFDNEVVIVPVRFISSGSGQPGLKIRAANYTNNDIGFLRCDVDGYDGNVRITRLEGYVPIVTDDSTVNGLMSGQSHDSTFWFNESGVVVNRARWTCQYQPIGILLPNTLPTFTGGTF